jgi:hypothetical protein
MNELSGRRVRVATNRQFANPSFDFAPQTVPRCEETTIVI